MQIYYFYLSYIYMSAMGGEIQEEVKTRRWMYFSK